MLNRSRFFSPAQYIRIYITVSLTSYVVTRAALDPTGCNQPKTNNNNIHAQKPIDPKKMPGKKAAGDNPKKAAGNARKAEAAAAKQAAADAKVAAVEDEQWNKGAKSTKKDADAASKKAEAAAKKAEREQLLAAEEASQPAKPKGAGKKVAERKTRGTLDLGQLDGDEGSAKKPSAINATGIDNALDALSLTGSSNDVKLERHPERRFKAAYEAYEARRLPDVVEENKGSSLRRNQMVEMVRKEFEKSPENPFNQVGNVAHNATREDLLSKKLDIRSGVEKRLGEK